MNRDENLTEAAMKHFPWGTAHGHIIPVSSVGPWRGYNNLAFPDSDAISKEEWLQRREELINCPPDSEAPEWAEWRAQDSDGAWCWYKNSPELRSEGFYAEREDFELARSGAVPNGRRWQDTLTRINRDDNTSTPEEEAEFDRIQARQDADKPHEADARLLDAQLKEAMVECGCGDKYPANSYGAGFTVANDGVCENCDAYESPSAHYSHEYRGIKLDPYRIAKIYNMDGGPREQIMKKTLRFTDKGQTEQQVVNEIRSALDRWQQMLDEDQ